MLPCVRKQSADILINYRSSLVLPYDIMDWYSLIIYYVIKGLKLLEYVEHPFVYVCDGSYDFVEMYHFIHCFRNELFLKIIVLTPQECHRINGIE